MYGTSFGQSPSSSSSVVTPPCTQMLELDVGLEPRQRAVFRKVHFYLPPLSTCALPPTGQEAAIHCIITLREYKDQIAEQVRWHLSVRDLWTPDLAVCAHTGRN